MIIHLAWYDRKRLGTSIILLKSKRRAGNKTISRTSLLCCTLCTTLCFMIFLLHCINYSHLSIKHHFPPSFWCMFYSTWNRCNNICFSTDYLGALWLETIFYILNISSQLENCCWSLWILFPSGIDQKWPSENWNTYDEHCAKTVKNWTRWLTHSVA